MNIPFSPPSDNHSPQIRVTKIRRVGIVAYPGIEILDVTGPMEVFAFANVLLQLYDSTTEPAYAIELFAAKPGPLTASCGLQIIATRAYSDVQEEIDTLLISGTTNIDNLLCDPELQDWVRAMAPKVRRMASVCTGAFLLAESGLLDGLRATSHWMFCNRLARDYPAVIVEPDRIFVRDGTISTSGGVTSGIDLALSMVEEDLGSELALEVARTLVVFLKRPGGQSQFSAYLTSKASRPELRDLQAWIMVNLTKDLRVETLAGRLCMSPRNFARFFLAEAGMTPAKFVELARIDAARHYLGSTPLSIELVADKSGFGDPERMRRAFIRQLGVNPQGYRDRFSGANPHSTIKAA
ncbi:MAG: GlxA family transcriptional regulator [Methylococcales bacterium]|nr:GlxA family transcriptional regulator [Methylococcales bacterium]MDD5632293.1 GlxA family transcriptional regulator [Methylococcales bacterium]